ncbi:serine hydrolase [Thermocrispum agreste]|nr:serine hydrolase [Thermocrispum agreste]
MTASQRDGGRSGISRATLLRGTVAAGAAIAGATVAGNAAPAAAVDLGGSPVQKIRRVYRRETRRAGGRWLSYVTLHTGEAEPVVVIDEDRDTEIRAASVNKLAMAVAVMDKVDRGDLRLDQRLELTQADIEIDPDTSGIWHLQKVYGDRLTLANVLVTLLVASENSALPLIARVCPRDELNGILAAKGFTVTRVSEHDQDPDQFFHGSTTPAEMHRLLTGLTQHTLLSAESCDFLLSIMRWTEPGYTDGIRRLMSSQERIRVAAKYGAYEDRRHEVGVIYDRDGAPTLIFSLFAAELSDQANYGATHPAVEARSVIGRAMLDAVDEL